MSFFHPFGLFMLFYHVQTIETPRLVLVACDTRILQSVLEGRISLAHTLGVKVPMHWTEFGSAPFRYVLEKTRSDPSATGWWNYLPVNRQDNKLIGSGGYKGPPDEAGIVEIGYEIMPTYRNRGLATELARGLADHAFTDPRVKQVIAHTLAEKNASSRVLAKCGFKRISELELGDDGLVWKWAFEK